MPVYEVSALTTLVTATANAPLCALRAVTRPLYVRELHIFWRTAAAATGGTLGLCRSTALGTGGLTSTTPVARPVTGGVPAATALLVTAWATLAPTVSGTAYFRRITAGAAVGNGVIWTFDPWPGVEVAGSAAATSELVITNTTATAPGTLEIIFVFEE